MAVIAWLTVLLHLVKIPWNVGQSQTCRVSGLRAQLVEHCTGIAEVKVRIPFRPSALLLLGGVWETVRTAHFKKGLFANWVSFSYPSAFVTGCCRNYHVFYYLLAGASTEDKEVLHLTNPEEYFYLNQVRFVVCKPFNTFLENKLLLKLEQFSNDCWKQ